MSVLGFNGKDMKSTWDKANINNPKVSRGCAPLTANRTSADCVQISLGPSILYIPLGVYHTGGFNAMNGSHWDKFKASIVKVWISNLDCKGVVSRPHIVLWVSDYTTNKKPLSSRFNQHCVSHLTQGNTILTAASWAVMNNNMKTLSSLLLFREIYRPQKEKKKTREKGKSQ